MPVVIGAESNRERNRIREGLPVFSLRRNGIPDSMRHGQARHFMYTNGLDSDRANRVSTPLIAGAAGTCLNRLHR
jgi:hypothetical protein